MSGDSIVAIFTIIIALFATFLIIKKKKMRGK